MEYRFLGNTGLQVSAIGFGNMINFHVADEETNVAIIKRAYELGVNFFDTAEIYGHGLAEEALGRAFKVLELPRHKLVVTTKIFMRVDEKGNTINRNRTLSRKHIIEGLDSSLKRLQLDYVDVVFAHQYDANTTIEEVCRAFNQVIEDGKAFYWATSNWSSAQIQEAINVCDSLKLHRPVADQCQYSMLERKQVEVGFTDLFNNHKYGTTIWSPLCGGVLTGKYNDHVPEVSRLNLGMGWIPKAWTETRLNAHINNPNTAKGLKELVVLANELGFTQSQLAVAWAIRNKDVSTAIIGARTVAQLEDTMKAVECIKSFTPELDARLEKLFNNRPDQEFDLRTFAPRPNRR